MREERTKKEGEMRRERRKISVQGLSGRHVNWPALPTVPVMFVNIKLLNTGVAVLFVGGAWLSGIYKN